MSIDVQVRVRPGVPNSVWSTADSVLYSTVQPSTRYVYNKVHAVAATNRSIFREVEPLLHAAFEGKHLTIMAYGQTGSGKTYSMIGTPDDSGIVPRAARLLLQRVSTQPGATLSVSCIETYNETVRDLLDASRSNADIVLQDAPDGTVRYERKRIRLESLEQFTELQNFIEAQRQYGVTDLNQHSSRSHLIITMEIQHPHSSTAGGGTTASIVHLVDLAGAECAARARTEGQALREGGFINRSLLALGNVVDALAERRPYVPYRESKLTRLLRSCFAGSGLTFILCCIHPGDTNVDQSTASLRFTQRAMRIKTDPVVVLPIAPLFIHQYTNAVKEYLANDDSTIERQSGMRDTFLHCDSTLQEIVHGIQKEMVDALHGLATAQRLLLAHDHAAAVDAVGDLYQKIHQATVEKAEEEQFLASVEQQREAVLKDLKAKQVQLHALHRQEAADQQRDEEELAEWEHQLYETKRQLCSPSHLLSLQENVERVKINFEWSVCVERIAHECIPWLTKALWEGGGKVEDGVEDGTSKALAEDWASRPDWRDTIQEQLLRERRVVQELEAARELVHEDIVTFVQREESNSPAEKEDRPHSQYTEGMHYPPIKREPTPDTLEAIDSRIELLEIEEQRLLERLQYRSHRRNLRGMRLAIGKRPLSRHRGDSEELDGEEEGVSTTPPRRARRYRYHSAAVPALSSPTNASCTASHSPTPRREPERTSEFGGAHPLAGPRVSSPSPLPISHPLRCGDRYSQQEASVPRSSHKKYPRTPSHQDPRKARSKSSSPYAYAVDQEAGLTLQPVRSTRPLQVIPEETQRRREQKIISGRPIKELPAPSRRTVLSPSPPSTHQRNRLK